MTLVMGNNKFMGLVETSLIAPGSVVASQDSR